MCLVLWKWKLEVFGQIALTTEDRGTAKLLILSTAKDELLSMTYEYH